MTDRHKEHKAAAVKTIVNDHVPDDDVQPIQAKCIF